MVLYNAGFTQRLRVLAAQEDFQTSFRVTEDQRKSQKDLEYAVRLLVHTFEYLDTNQDVQEFLDDAVIRIMRQQNPDEAMETISWSISTLVRIFGNHALMPTAEEMDSRFSLRALECIAVGIARNREAILEQDEPDSFIRSRVGSFWEQEEVAEMSSTGLRGTTRIRRTVPFRAGWFNPND